MTKVREFKFDPRKNVRIRERPRLSIKFNPDEDMTQQHFKDECDVNKIVARYRATGVLPQGKAAPMYGDFTKVPEYLQSMNIVRDAQQAFNSLSAELRKQFNNDPVEFLAFVDDPKNADKLLEMGLRKPPEPEPGPVRVEVVNPAQPAEKPSN